MKQSPTLLFESSAFGPVQGEDEATNPGVFGRALAHWLRHRLRVEGIAAGEVIPEDFGWIIPVKRKSYSLYVACSNGEAPNGWMVFATAKAGLVSRLFGKDQSGTALESLYVTLHRCLEAEPSIHGIREQG
jgi:hypothetical protein